MNATTPKKFWAIHVIRKTRVVLYPHDTLEAAQQYAAQLKTFFADCPGGKVFHTREACSHETLTREIACQGLTLWHTHDECPRIY